MADAASLAVLGFRPHTYWTAATLVAGSADAPRVLARRRIDFAEEYERFVYHQASEMAPDKAEAFVAATRTAVEARARRGLDALLAGLRADGVQIRRAVVPAATAKAGALQEMLQSHARIHAGEGDFYREAVATACAAQGLEVVRIAERDLGERVCERLGAEPECLDDRLEAMGAELGPPWSEDQRRAVLAAWIGL